MIVVLLEQLESSVSQKWWVNATGSVQELGPDYWIQPETLQDGWDYTSLWDTIDYYCRQPSTISDNEQQLVTVRYH